MAVDLESPAHHAKPGGWQLVSNDHLPAAEPSFMGMLRQTVEYVVDAIVRFSVLINHSLQPSSEIHVWMQDAIVASDSLHSMLECILVQDSEKLEKILLEHVDEVNDPIGLPFELPSGRFANHPATSQMVIMQHPRQTLLDIACGMPNGPIVWVLLTYGAKSSTHPLGSDLALHNAIKNGRHLTVQALLTPGRSDVNGLSNTRWRPLLQAVFWTGPTVVSVLLKRGARVDDVGPSPTSSGMYTALQLCLERRAREYGDEDVRSKCNDNLKLLLDAGANIHLPPPEGSTAGPFEKFIEPWHNYENWNMRLSWAETECLGKFVEKGADVSAKFFGTPCAASSSNTFIHQALWHSPLNISRRVVHSFSAAAPLSGVSILHEVVGSCADAKRHCEEVTNDIELLLERGVDSNMLDIFGHSPLRKCIEQASKSDVLAITQKLLDGGANPENEDADGVQPYVVAARTLHDPLRHEILQNMLKKMRGHHTKTQEGRTYKWEPGLFPIPEQPTYQQTLACTKADDDLRLSMHEMIPIDVGPAFQRAYLAIISGRLLDKTSKAAAATKISEKDRWDIILTLSLRKGADLPDYQFDQALVINLLGFPKINTGELSSSSTPQNVAESCENEVDANAVPAYQPFQFNTSSPATLARTSSAPQQSHGSPTSNDAFVGDTTQLRWPNPESAKAPAPATAYVLQYKCGECGDERLLTKTESRKHEVEHAHTAQCHVPGCSRRFCRELRKREGCQDHLFMGSV